MTDRPTSADEYRRLGHELLDGLLDENVRAVVEFARHLGRQEDEREVRAFEQDHQIQAELDQIEADTAAGGGVSLDAFLKGQRTTVPEPADV